jgi:glycosyltransferase involved in cell wall biosynthesis
MKYISDYQRYLANNKYVEAYNTLSKILKTDNELADILDEKIESLEKLIPNNRNINMDGISDGSNEQINTIELKNNSNNNHVFFSSSTCLDFSDWDPEFGPGQIIVSQANDTPYVELSSLGNRFYLSKTVIFKSNFTYKFKLHLSQWEGSLGNVCALLGSELIVNEIVISGIDIPSNGIVEFSINVIDGFSARLRIGVGTTAPIQGNASITIKSVDIFQNELSKSLATRLNDFTKDFVDPELLYPMRRREGNKYVEVSDTLLQKTENISFILTGKNNVEILKNMLDWFVTQNNLKYDFELILIAQKNQIKEFEKIYEDYVSRLNIYLVVDPSEGNGSDIRKLAAEIARNNLLVFIDYRLILNNNFIRECTTLYSTHDLTTHFSLRNVAIDGQVTDRFKSIRNSIEPYLFFNSSLLIINRSLFLEIGGFIGGLPERAQDIIFGYELWSRGHFLAPIDSDLLASEVDLNISHRSILTDHQKESFNNLVASYCPSITNRYRKLKDENWNLTQPIRPLFSVYVPVFNTEHYVEECINSVLNQSIQDYEIVIVDDGSNERTKAILRKFADNPKVQIFYKSNGGIASASNLAIKMASGEYIVQLDSDDLLLPNALEELANFYNAHPTSECVYTKHELIDELGRAVGPGWSPERFDIFENLVGLGVSHLRSFRRGLYFRTSGFDETIENAVDYDFYLKLSEECSIEHLNKVLYKYRVHASQTSSRASEVQISNHIKVVNRHLERLNISDCYAVAANPFTPRQCYILKKGSSFESKIKHTKFRQPLFDDLTLPVPVGSGNDYSSIQSFVENYYKDKENPEYTEKISIVVPVYNRAERLSRCLAGICKQTYPIELMEVIVADDGSSDDVLDVVAKYSKIINIRYVKQRDEGYRLSAVRNLGIRMSLHRNISIIDCDLIPLPGFIESFMKYLHHFDNVVLLGHQKFVDPTGISDDDILHDVGILDKMQEILSENETMDSKGLSVTKDWRYKLYEETNYLKDDQFPYRAFSSGHVAYRKAAIESAGFYDESFKVWGSEDNETGYRLFQKGFYFIPILDALDLHQEPPSGKNETNRLSDREISRELLQNKVPATRGWFGKPYELKESDLPLVSIGIPMRNTGRFVVDAIQSVLNQTVKDYEIVVYDDASTDDTLMLVEKAFGENSKVRIIKGLIHKNVTYARNQIIQACRGEFIGFLDSDDLLMPSCIEECVRLLRANNNVGLVCTGYKMINEDGGDLNPGWTPPAFDRRALLLGNIFTHFRMFRLRDWNRSRKWSNDEIANMLYGEDWDLCLKLAEVSEFDRILSPLYCYRVRSDSITNSNDFIFKRDQTKSVISRWINYLNLSYKMIATDKNNPHAFGYIK